MVPYDYELQHSLFNKHLTYTRYADDLLISGKYDFDYHDVVEEAARIIAPFQLKHEKTRYGSSAGRNWNLGLMLNKDNNITIGRKKKERIRATIFNFLNDFTSGRPWDILDVQVMLGQLSYIRSIEPDFVTEVIDKYNQKLNCNFNVCADSILSL
jgi:hypothetical protein